MMHPHSELRAIEDRIGHGVFATRPIPRGTIVWILCRFDLVFTEPQVAALPEPYRRIVGRYGYIDADRRFILCWDHARYINHSCEPNMLGVGPELEVATRDIAAGEQITCEYGGLNITTDLLCGCGSSHCRKRIRADDVLRLADGWDAQVAEAMKLAAHVEQPLLPFMQKPGEFHAWATGAAAPPSHRAYHAGLSSTAKSADASLLWAPDAPSRSY